MGRAFVGVHPQGGPAVPVCKGAAGLLRQAEKPCGERIGQAAGFGVGQHCHAAHIAGGVPRGQVDQVGIAHALIFKIALIIAAGDKALPAGQRQPCRNIRFLLAQRLQIGRSRRVKIGCAVALATDLNPGSCFSGSIPLTFALACIYMKLTVAEAITAITLNGAAALGRADRIGSIEAGKQGDFVLLGTDNPHILPYYTGMNAVKLTIKGGRILHSN